MAPDVTWFVDQLNDPTDDPFSQMGQPRHLLGQCKVCGRAADKVVPADRYSLRQYGIWIPPWPERAVELLAEHDEAVARYRNLLEKAGACECEP
jgi:hypothetical protein